MAHVAVTTTLPPVLECLWLEEVLHTHAKKISTRRNVLSLKFLQRRHVTPFPSSYSHDTEWPTRGGKGPHHRTAQMFIEATFERLRQTGSAHKGMSLNRQATKPTTSRFNFEKILAQHVLCFLAAQGYFCHLPVLQEEGNCVARSMQLHDEQRAITHVVFTRAA